LSYAARGPRRRSRATGKSTEQTGEIAKITETADIVGIANRNPRIRKKRGISIALTM
jgi:hypothetical protein